MTLDLQRSALKAASLSILLLPSSPLQSQRAGREQRGGPPGVFHSNVPEHDLTIVQGNPAPTSVDLILMSPRDLAVTVSHEGGGAGQHLALKALSPTKVTLVGLKPGSVTPYEAAWEGGSLKGTARTPKAKGSSFTFAIQADSHLDENTTMTAYLQTLDSMKAASPDFVVDLGDTFMTGKHSPFEKALTQYRAQSWLLGRVSASSPLFLVLGNHDGETGWVERGMPGLTSWASQQRRAHFPTPETGSFFSGDTKDSHYFEFTWGDVQIIVLDPFMPTKNKPARTNDNWAWTLGDTQRKWLERTLESSSPSHRFVFIHHLVGGFGKDTRGGAEASVGFEWGGQNADGSAGFQEHRPGLRKPIHDLLVEGGVDAVFHGHDHLYARQERDGLVYWLVPQPSHARGDSVQSAAEYGYKSGTILGSSGWLKASITPDKAVVEYVKTSGRGLGNRADAHVFTRG